MCQPIEEKLRTFGNMEFMEENSQEDPTYNPEKEEMMAAENEMSNVSLQDKDESDDVSEGESEDSETEENTIESDEENLLPEQIPVGLKEIKLLRKQEKMAECLVFTNEELEELPSQTINELDSNDLDDEDGADCTFDVEKEPEVEENSEDDNEENESIDGDDLKEATEVETANGNCKLMFKDIPKNKEVSDEEEECEEEETEDMEEEKSVEPYNEEEDADFNPVMCGDTLSDIEVDEEEEDKEEELEVLHQAEGTCMLKCDFMKIPMESLENEEEQVSQESMECE